MPQEDAKEIDSDDESVATEDIVEEQLIPEPEPVPLPVPVPEPAPPKPRVKKTKAAKVPPHAPYSEQTSEGAIMPTIEPKKRGRPKGSKTNDDRQDIIGYTKDELIEMVKTQHELLKQHELIAAEKRDYLRAKLENKPPKVKKERTEKQKAATERMKAANAARRQAKLDSIAKDVKGDLEKSVSDLVQDEVVKIIQAPMRTLTPERQRKVKVVEEVALSKYKSSF
tara:strand:+ start:52 stop:726 length:675 start_codon:yes stop_codon:yes gene_type:complete